jgi:hypothetical protein
MNEYGKNGKICGNSAKPRKREREAKEQKRNQIRKTIIAGMPVRGTRNLYIY